ncbi:MAG: DUF3311 domain-containing protein [Opitutae bacterium]|nr:DUF3311 domain-containing protein [Opitutae bacterium]
MRKKSLIIGFLILLFFLHQDFWLKDNPSLVFGFLPATLAYHMFWTVAAAFGWWCLVRFAWPPEFEESDSATSASLPKEGGAEE